MLIAGWGRDAKETAYLGILKCSNCKNWSHFGLAEVNKKATAYFVTVAKWGTKYYAVCDTCQAAYELDEEAANKMLVASMEIPDRTTFAAIWNDIDERVAALIEDEQLSESTLLALVEQMTNSYPEHWVRLAFSTKMESLGDEDTPS